jgi:tellurite resistance protein TehA-like permease
MPRARHAALVPVVIHPGKGHILEVWVSWICVLVSLLANIVMVAFQVAAFRATGHRSLKVLAWGSSFGLICIALQVLPNLVVLSAALKWLVFAGWASSFVMTCAFALWGSIALFSAFEREVARNRSAPQEPPPL